MDDGKLFYFLIFHLVRSATVLKQVGLKTVYNAINFLKDENGNYYYIPNFCINDPFFEKEIKTAENETIQGKELKVKKNFLLCYFRFLFMIYMKTKKYQCKF